MASIALTPAGPAPRSREIDARVGMMVFLASWGMVFATLFFCCAVYRLQSPVWPPAGERPLPESARVAAWVNTVLMLASSFVLHRYLAALDRGAGGRGPIALASVFVCGSVFLALQIDTWAELWQSGMRIQDGVSTGLFYAITVFHGLHVLAGLLLWIWAVPSAVRAKALLERVGEPRGRTLGAAEQAEISRHRIRLRSTGMFWHFVDVAWLATFFVLYIL